MAHSILEFGENQLIMRDAELLAVLEQMQDSLRDNPDDKLDFLSEFLLSDMVHVTGGLDPDLDRHLNTCLLYTSPSPRDQRGSRMPSSA